jgi:hypothetical protein
MNYTLNPNEKLKIEYDYLKNDLPRRLHYFENKTIPDKLPDEYNKDDKDTIHLTYFCKLLKYILTKYTEIRHNSDQKYHLDLQKIFIQNNSLYKKIMLKNEIDYKNIESFKDLYTNYKNKFNISNDIDIDKLDADKYYKYYNDTLNSIPINNFIQVCNDVFKNLQLSINDNLIDLKYIPFDTSSNISFYIPDWFFEKMNSYIESYIEEKNKGGSPPIVNTTQNLPQIFSSRNFTSYDNKIAGLFEKMPEKTLQNLFKINAITNANTNDNTNEKSNTNDNTNKKSNAKSKTSSLQPQPKPPAGTPFDIVSKVPDDNDDNEKYYINMHLTLLNVPILDLIGGKTTFIIAKTDARFSGGSENDIGEYNNSSLLYRIFIEYFYTNYLKTFEELKYKINSISDINSGIIKKINSNLIVGKNVIDILVEQQNSNSLITYVKFTDKTYEKYYNAMKKPSKINNGTSIYDIQLDSDDNSYIVLDYIDSNIKIYNQSVSNGISYSTILPEDDLRNSLNIGGDDKFKITYINTNINSNEDNVLQPIFKESVKNYNFEILSKTRSLKVSKCL